MQPLAPEATALPRKVRYLVGLMGIIVGISALALGTFSLTLTARPIWLLFGFELAVIVAAVVAIVIARGKASSGEGLAILCVAGTFAVASFLGWLGSSRGQLPMGGDRGTVSITTLLYGRLLASGFVAALAAYAVLRRRPSSSVPLLFRGVAFGLPLAIAAGIYVVAGSAIAEQFAKWPEWVTTASSCLAAIAALILVSAAGHYLIRAFESGLLSDEAEPANA